MIFIQMKIKSLVPAPFLKRRLVTCFERLHNSADVGFCISLCKDEDHVLSIDVNFHYGAPHSNFKMPPAL